MTSVKKPDELKRKNCRFFLVYGADSGKADDLIDDTIQWFQSSEPGLKTQRFIEDDLSRDFASFENAICNNSLFGSAAIGRLHLHSEAVGNRLAAFISDTSEIAGALFINGHDISPKSKLVSVFEKQENAVSLRLFEPNIAELINLAKSILIKENVASDDNTIRMIIDATAKDTLSVRAQFNGLCLFIGKGGRLNADDAAKLIVNNREGMLDELVSLVFEGKIAQALESVYFCIRDGENPIRVFSLLINRAKLIFNIIGNLETGDSVSNLVKERRFGIFWKQQDSVARQVNIWARRNLRRALTDLIDFDDKCKSKGGSVDSELLLERAILRVGQLSGVKS